MKRYGFWIIPENDFYQEIEKIVAKYSKEYNFPIFTPHMTLHGPVSSTDEEIVSKISKAAASIKSFEVEIGDVEFSTTYFQSVFVRIKTNAELLKAHMTLREILGFKEKHVFMPHASLVYGDFEMEVREKIAKEIKLVSTKFKANKITIVRADSRNPKDWDIVAQIPLV